jgi:hypothetical protein
LALVLVLAPAGCSDSKQPSDSGRQQEDLGAAILADLSPIEREVLADKQVRSAEFTSANQVTLACLRKAGAVIASNPDDVLTMATIQGGSEQALERIRACKAETDAIGAVWVLQNQPSPEERQAGRQKFLACIRSAGVDLPDGSSLQDALAAAQSAESTEARSCAEAFARADISALPGLAEALDNLDTSTPTSTPSQR